jgi:hypothetical protein
MKASLTPGGKWRIVRLLIGILAVATSYLCLFLAPPSLLYGVGVTAGAAMSAGGARSGSLAEELYFLPLLIGVVTWIVAVVFGPGLIIRLLCVPSGMGYIGILYLLQSIG